MTDVLVAKTLGGYPGNHILKLLLVTNDQLQSDEPVASFVDAV